MLHPLARPQFLLALAAVATLGACSFRPAVPSAVVTCVRDVDCPEGLTCDTEIGLCCRPDLCGTGEEPASTRADSGLGPQGEPDASRPDAEPTATVPMTPVAAEDAGAAGDAPENSDAPPGRANTPECSGTDSVPDLGPDRQSFCTMAATNTFVSLAIHSLAAGDPSSARSYGGCWSSLALGRETTDATTSAGRPLSMATLATVADIVIQYKKICETHKARIVGAVAASWARQATNQTEVRAKFREATGIELDVYPAADEFNQTYLAVTRNRLGRLVLMPGTTAPELVYWSKNAPAPTREALPFTYDDINSMYLGAVHPSFSAARVALRGRLKREREASFLNLRTLVQRGTLDPGMIVGPAWAMVPMALAGELKDGKGWQTVAAVYQKTNVATVTPSPYGRIFGPAPIRPEAVDNFFSSVDDAQWLQLRDEPLRTGYSGELFYTTVLLDLLGDEVKATEFAFVYANSQLGYLFAKILPPPN